MPRKIFESNFTGFLGNAKNDRREIKMPARLNAASKSLIIEIKV